MWESHSTAALVSTLLPLFPSVSLSLCQQGVMESFLGTALAGSVFCFFGGQPLIILSSTGPILIFEKLLFEFSKWAALEHRRFIYWEGSCSEETSVMSGVNMSSQHIIMFTVCIKIISGWRVSFEMLCAVCGSICMALFTSGWMQIQISEMLQKEEDEEKKD